MAPKPTGRRGYYPRKRPVSYTPDLVTTTHLPVGRDTVLAIPAVYAAVKAVCDAVGTLPVSVYRDSPADKEHDHPVYRLLTAAPNPVQTAKAFRSSMVFDQLAFGESVTEIQRNGLGEAVALWRVEPTRLGTATEAGRYVHRIDAREVDPADLLHVLYFSLDGYRGTSPFDLCVDTLALSIGIEKFGANFFVNGARPSLVVKVPKGTPPEKKREIGEQFTKQFSGLDNVAKVVIAEADTLEFERLTVTADEGQFNETRVQQVKQVARLMSVPPFVVGDHESDIYANYQTVNENYARNTLRPICVGIEQEVERKLLGDGYRCELILEGLLRGSFREQCDYLSKLAGGPVVTVNEARRRLGYEPLPGGDVLRQTGVDTANGPDRNPLGPDGPPSP